MCGAGRQPCVRSCERLRHMYACSASHDKETTMLTRFVPGLLVIIVLHPTVALAQASTAVMVSPFERRCAICHDNPGTEERAPNREALRQLTPERALAALTTGSMAVNAEGMTDEQKRAMAELVTGKPFDGVAARQASAMKNQCAAPLSLQNPWTQPQWNGWSPAPHSQWRFQPAATAKLTA